MNCGWVRYGRRDREITHLLDRDAALVCSALAYDPMRSLGSDAQHRVWSGWGTGSTARKVLEIGSETEALLALVKVVCARLVKEAHEWVSLHFGPLPFVPL